MQPVDLSRIRTRSLQSRSNKVTVKRFAQPPRAGRSFAGFLASLPGILAGEELQAVTQAIVNARRNQRAVIVGLGAHVIKCGLSPVLIELMRRGIVTGLAMNGSGAIHDFEIGLIGATSEDVAAGLQDGSFGMADQTGKAMHTAINRVLERRDAGMGALLAEMLEEVQAPFRKHSLLAAGRALGLPVTIHVALGTDILHMHPDASGSALGQASFNDFRLFAAEIAELSGGVYLNMGSAVILPEVFLKAFTIAQNLGGRLTDFVTVNMDMMLHYRPRENVVHRPALVGGRGCTLLGRHEIMIPLLAHAVVEAMAAEEPMAPRDAALNGAATANGGAPQMQQVDDPMSRRS
jgi:hypothetical protein